MFPGEYGHILEIGSFKSTNNNKVKYVGGRVLPSGEIFTLKKENFI